MRSLALATLATALSFLGGCGTLPDAKPFADATSSLSASISAGGSAITTTLGEPHDVTPEDPARYAELSSEFEAAWRGRVEAAKATATYADSISNVISAGNESAKTVEKVADSLASLAEAVSVPLATPAFGVTKDVASFIVQRVAIVRASAKLEVAMEQAQPAIDRLAKLIVEDSELRLKPLLVVLHKNIQSGIQSTYAYEDNYRTEVRKRRKVALAEALKDSSKLSKVQELDQAEQAVTPILQERDKKLDGAATAYKTRVQLIDALSDATTAWAQAHRDLAAAVKEKRKVNVAELEATVTELKALVKKVRDL